MRVSLLGDLRLACRLFRRTPGLTAVAIASIAISVGAAAVVFTAVHAVLLRPLPYWHPDELVQLRTDFTGTSPSSADWVSWNDMQDVARASRTLASLGTYHYALFNLAGDGHALPEALYGLYVSAGMFPALGVTPMLGRNVLPEEDRPGRDREMILGYGLWVRRFQADRNVIGRTVQVNGHGCTIVGVMPEGFDFPMRLATSVRTPSQHMDFWAPLGADPARIDRAAISYGAVARLAKGSSLAQARQELASIGARLASEYPRTNQRRVLHLSALSERTLGFARTGLMLVMAAALLFLAIGCANVANLQLARALTRSREIAVRLALGAGRGRIVRQLVIESCVLGLVGGLLGYALTAAAWAILPAAAPMSIPRLAASRADWAVFTFTLAISLANGIVFGLAPALAAGRGEPVAMLRESGSRSVAGGVRNRLRSFLVAGEVAVAVLLVAIGGLLAAGFVKLLRTDPGFQADRLQAAIIVPAGDWYQVPARRAALFRGILDMARRLPGVEQAATVDALPFTGENHGGFVATEESGILTRGPQLVAEIDRTSAGYLPAMGVRLSQGRWFQDDDVKESRDVAIVNAVAADRLFPGQSPLGKRLCVNCLPDKPQQWARVVGVAANTRHAGLDSNEEPAVYLASGAMEAAQFLVVRTKGPAEDLARTIRAGVAAVDPNQPVFLSASMRRLIADSLADRRFIMTLLAVTACLALLLAAAGVYGVISYATSCRTKEIGVRMALGASPRRVLALILGQGARLGLPGAVIGLGAAVPAAHAIRAVLPGLALINPAWMMAGAALVIGIAMLACSIPAWRATRIEPVSALRDE